MNCIGPNAREYLRHGFKQMADALEVTLGPRGRLVAVERDSRRKAPELLNDGARLARRFYGLPSRFESMGLLMARHLAWQIEEEVGDGSTMAVVMARRLIEDGCRLITAGVDPMLLRRALEKAQPLVIEALKAQAQPMDSTAPIIALAQALIGNAELAKHLHECFDVVGPQGAIEVRPSNSVTHDREYIQGALWNKGWESQSFATHGGEAILSNPYILFTTHRLSAATDLMPIMQKVAEQAHTKQRGLAVVSFNIEGEALNLLVMNKRHGTLPTLAVNAPGAGDERFDILQDLATLCGGKLVAEEAGHQLENVALADLGSADEFRAVRSAFTLIGGKGRPAAIRQRVADIRKQIAKTKDHDIRNQLFERAGKLSGGVALLRVGGATETEREFYKTRCEDAVRVIRAAMESGVVAGGGWAYIYAAQTLQQTALTNEGYDDDALARSLLVAALCQPARAILRNSGYDAAAIVPIHPTPTPMRNTALGFDVTQGDMVDMFAANIVDPVNVLIAAFRAALSAAIMILTTEALIHKPRDNRDKEVTLDP